MAISSGTVASTRIAPGAKLPRIDLSVSTWAESGTVRTTMERLVHGLGIGVSGNFAAIQPWPRFRARRLAPCLDSASQSAREVPPSQSEKRARFLPPRYLPQLQRFGPRVLPK